jgi:hypothetical protein|tara:strand:+ start:536 stop:1348 length:813 start_codon:yes stop_codon:yes gene_type:complete
MIVLFTGTLKRTESILLKCVLVLICCSPWLLASGNELTIIGSVHAPTKNYAPSNLAEYISRLEPDVVLTEGDPSMFNNKGKVANKASGLEVEAYRQVQRHHEIPIVNVSMERRNQAMREIAYNQTLGEVFQVVQGAYNSDSLINASLFEKILETFSARSSCMQNSTFEELQSETCVNAFKNNSAAIFKDMQTLLERNPNLSDQLKRWKPLVAFHNQRHKKMADNVAEHVCEGSGKKYLLIVGVLHFSELRKILSTTDCDFKLRTYSAEQS